MKDKCNVFWFRRDLRLKDNAGLYHALKQGKELICLFIFDNEILEKLSNRKDARVEFIHSTVSTLKRELCALGSDLMVMQGKAIQVWETIVENYSIEGVFCNADYEPSAQERDANIRNLLSKSSIEFTSYKDHCIFDYTEVLKDNAEPYTVFTPYAKKWKSKLNSFYLSSYPVEKYFQYLQKRLRFKMPTLLDIGFQNSGLDFPSKEVSEQCLLEYAEKRNFPAMDASSRLSLHFRFGTISIREKARMANRISEVWLNELIWRDFYIQIMAHFPYATTSAFKPAYDRIEWINDTDSFESWCNGETGYPIVDAGMRELNATGFMHNRVRMITASFLCKHLLIDWRWGEAYFAEKLLDFELASNNGGWQWAAGSGVDAAPYFRIFNPALQTERFDPHAEYIKRWVPEFGTAAYPKAIVEHGFARQRCLAQYKKDLARL